jgi:1,4-alpha-glucan branching enzyme
MGAMNVSKAPSTAGVRSVPIQIRVDGAKEVAITGDFNRWEKEGLRLKPDGKGTWRTVLELRPGEYQYRLIVEGQWRDHPEAAKRVPNPFGTENCVLIVT